MLVVDDDSDARELVARVLSESRAEVLTAASAAEALLLVERERPDVLVSDIAMPEIDGYELLRQVRALGEGRGGKLAGGRAHRVRAPRGSHPRAPRRVPRPRREAGRLGRAGGVSRGRRDAATSQVAEKGPSASLLLSHLCGVAPLRLRVRSVAPLAS